MADIVYVDDDPTEFLAKATADQESRVVGLRYDTGPDAAPLNPPAEALVWLFDFFLVAAAPGNSTDENGLSLFQKWKVTPNGRPTTVVVSSDLQKAVGEPLGPIARHHVIAQRHGVEWIGDKSEETLRQLVELADAAAAIAKALKPSTAEDTLGTYESEHLSFDVLTAPRTADWANSAQRQIDRARPPREVPVTSEPATARAIIGWLIGHVLPYPSFLLTDAHAALRLKMTPASFRTLAATVLEKANPTGFDEAFISCRYDGPLATFLGRRWWRAAIDDLAWKLSQADEGYQPALEKHSGIAVEWLNQSEPVLLSDADLVETDEIAEATDCVRVTEEDFPASVEAAWVRITTAQRDRLLAAKVVYEDRDLLSAVA